MNHELNQPAFLAYAVTCLLLCANLLFLWAYSGAVRGKTKLVMNEEDVATFGGGLSPADPAPVARVLRAHNNAQASIYPFLLTGWVFVATGGGAGAAAIYFGIFTVARLGHSWAYLGGRQPWRTVCFLVGGLSQIGLMLHIVWLLTRAS